MKRREFLASIAIIPFAEDSIVHGTLLQETALLSRRVTLQELRLFGANQPVELGNAKLIIVHIWGDHCAPCIEEMPIWKRLTTALASRLTVRFLFVVETYSQTRLTQFLNKRADQIPQTKQYLIPYGDTAGGEGSQLRVQIDNRAQPITLLLDRGLVVRQAFVGSIKDRVNDLVGSWNRLFDALRGEPLPLENLLSEVAELATQKLSGQYGKGIARKTAELAMLHRKFSHKTAPTPQVLLVNPPGGAVAHDESWIRSLEGQAKFSKIRFSYSQWAFPLHALLLLDAQQIVRQAFLGELKSTRTSEVLLALERFAALS